MPVEIPASHRDLFRKPLVATLITVTADGHPHGTVVWCGFNGSQIQISITDESQKYRNIKENPLVSVVVVDTNEPYRYIEVRGTASLSRENASAIVMELARKYNRPEFDVSRAADKRVIVSITPTKVIPHGR